MSEGIREKVLNEGIAGLRKFVEAHHVNHRQPGTGFADLERGLHARVMDLERSLLAEELVRADVDADQVFIDDVPTGGSCARKRRT